MQSFRLINLVDELWNSPNRIRWMQWIMVIGVLAVSALIASRASTQLSIMIIVLIGFAVGLLALLRWPNLGIVAAIVAGFFLGFSGPGGINASVLALAGLAGLWIVDMIIRGRKIVFTDRQTTIPILVFIVSALLSFVIGMLPWYPLARHAPMTAQFGGLLIFTLSAVTLLMVANIVRDLRWLQVITWTFVALGSLYIVGRLVPPVGNVLRPYMQPGMTTGSLFWVWLLVIPFSQALLNNRLHLVWRAALMLLVVLTLYVAMFQSRDWKSGYLPPLAGAGTIVALILRRKVFWFIPVGLALVWFLGTEALATDQYSAISRWDAWKIVIQLTLINPIFGIGFSNYYWYTHLIPILGWRVAFNSHSQYIDMFSQTGLVGLAVFFWIFWAVGKLGWEIRDQASEGFAKAYVYGALGGLVGTLVAGGLVDWILPFVYNIGMTGFRSSMLSWIFLGGLVAVRAIATPQLNSRSNS